MRSRSSASFVKGARKLRLQPYALAVGVASALACGGGGIGVGSGPAYSAAPVVFTTQNPTQIRFAPDGRLFYTELDTGNVRIVENGTLLATPFATLPVSTSGEQGLLGLAFDPDFANNGFVYVFHSHPGPTARQRVVRFTDVNNVGTAETVIVDDLPVANNHCGGRIGFGQDGMLYVTLGDVQDPANSQDDNVLPGKLLRYEPDGDIPADNPIPGNPLYAKGLRNPFGLAFHPLSGRPYLSENGPNCDDELNRIAAGANYGWRPGYPCGDAQFTVPIRRFNPSIAPTGIAFYTGAELSEFTGDLFMGSFVDGAIRRLRIDDGNGAILEEEILLQNRVGGVFDVTTGSDGGLYFSDGTGIYRIVRT
jgi:glucose/arabinose dehydrogenase